MHHQVILPVRKTQPRAVGVQCFTSIAPLDKVTNHQTNWFSQRTGDIHLNCLNSSYLPKHHELEILYDQHTTLIAHELKA